MRNSKEQKLVLSVGNYQDEVEAPEGITLSTICTNRCMVLTAVVGQTAAYIRSLVHQNLTKVKVSVTLVNTYVKEGKTGKIIGFYPYGNLWIVTFTKKLPHELAFN